MLYLLMLVFLVSGLCAFFAGIPTLWVLFLTGYVYGEFRRAQGFTAGPRTRPGVSRPGFNTSTRSFGWGRPGQPPT